MVKYLSGITVLLYFSSIYSQTITVDKCGFNEVLARESQKLLGRNWGYGYNDLLADLETWGNSPFIRIDSIGASVQGRAIWQLTITSDTALISPRHTVFMHVRTHPNEVQGWWVAKEFMNLLLSGDPHSVFILNNCTFYIIPMYNPDGVELGYSRENANGIDIESNWNANPVEPEVAVLRSRFETLMTSDAPIEIALNMHASIACRRYFVYHHENGTSETYTQLEQQFINGVRSHFMVGIEPWNYFISWAGGTPAYFPESWFWSNYGGNVMALTYEDMNCTEAGMYDSTAYALLHGIGEYLALDPNAGIVQRDNLPNRISLFQNFPNPFNSLTTIQYNLLEKSNVRLTIIDVLAREIVILVNEVQAPGLKTVHWDGNRLPSGVYFILLDIEKKKIIKKAVLLK